MTPEQRVTDLVAEIDPVDDDAAQAARHRHQTLLKPPGSLGRLEDLGVQLAAIAGRCPPPVPGEPAVVVAAGDHGVHARGVTPWPQQITAAMVEQFCAGRAAVNVLAHVAGARVSVLDVGVAHPVPDHPRLRRARVRDGTADLSAGPAMTREEAARAVLAGAGIVDELVAAGVDLLVTGDMGIANTTPSACLAAAFTGVSAAMVTGRGAGVDDDMFGVKVTVVEEALTRHQPDPEDPLGVLAAVGGLEHAALVGIMLASATERLPVLLDGVVSNTAALVAARLCPHLPGYLVAGHRSTEPAATAALDRIGLDPLLELDLRLGEGTGALLGVPLVIAAARVLSDMAELDDLGLSG